MARSILSWAAMPLLIAVMACGNDVPEWSAPGQLARPATSSLSAMKAERSGPNRAPVIESISLTPRSPQIGDRVHAEVRVMDPDGDRVRLAYAWAVNGLRTSETGTSFVVENASRGWTISVSVVASDGHDESLEKTEEFTLGNSPPILAGVRFEPSNEFFAKQRISALPDASDPDGDPLDYTYTWYVNDRQIHEEGPVLDGAAIKRGDRVVLAVMASDGELESDELRSDPIEIANSAPDFSSQPGAIGADGVFRYQIQVDDPDGDRAFMYRLKNAPANMQLGALSGKITWKPEEADAGSNVIEIEVDDRMGGKAVQAFTLDVEFAKTSPPASAR